MISGDLVDRYGRDGFVSPIQIVSSETAARHRHRLEKAESVFGKLHYKPKVHCLLTSPLELATRRAALDVVEAILGPDILLYNINYIIKEPGTSAHVSWHQDLTYWGFDSDDQVSMWLALSPATVESGCMKMIPGSHRSGKMHHNITDDPDNVLYSGQTVVGVEENSAVICDLEPGQASFHHGWTLHASMPNKSDDRRIGLNVQYIAPHVRQLKSTEDSALLVRGKDRYGYYEKDILAESDLTPEGIENLKMYEQRYMKMQAA